MVDVLAGRKHACGARAANADAHQLVACLHWQFFVASQDRLLQLADLKCTFRSLITRTTVKHCVRLRESAQYRRETGSALVCGRDLVEELAPLLAPMRAMVALDAAALPGVSRWPLSVA